MKSLIRMLRVVAAVIGVCGLYSARLMAADSGLSGEQIFKKLCASCHGALGEGVKEHYGTPLIGSKSVFELAQAIEKTMPDGEPELCTGEDARKVAAWIHDAFYSPEAQARINPPRIELSRLTVQQYRNSVADLIGSFRPNAEPLKSERGLRGEYFKSRRFRGNERVLERIDSAVTFDFGEGSPDEKIEPVEFGIKWQGSLLAPESGEYELIIRTDNGMKLWFNTNDPPLIDAAVRSGTDTEYRRSIKLLGGRAYPLRIEFFKSKEGKDKRAAISLKWRPPRGVDEVIPTRFLVPQRFPEQFVVETPFPPDDRSLGYERGIAVSKEWETATTDAAIETAGYVASHLKEFTGGGNEAEQTTRAKEFCSKFVARAFRHPLTEEEKQFFIERQFAADRPLETSVKRVILLTLQSPRFLFIEPAHDKTDDWDIAARLSLTLWDSLPDEALVQAAATGQLHTPEQVQTQAERMLADPRCHARLRAFFMQWLKVDTFPEIARDSNLYPDFTPQIVADLKTSLDLFLDDVIWSEAADYRQLLLSNSVYLNGRLAQFYGVSLPADADFQKVSLDSDVRAGVLTHPFLMTGFAYTASSSPIHRGVFISRSVLGRALRAPPEAVAPLSPDLAPELTTRERVLLQTKAEVCQSCHSMINALGFTLENFDAVGRFRREEKNKSIDATGSYITRDGQSKTFGGVRELATYLADSPETHAAFSEQLFYFLVRQPIRAYGLKTPEELRDQFEKQQFNIRKLTVAIALRAALQGTTPKVADNTKP